MCTHLVCKTDALKDLISLQILANVRVILLYHEQKEVKLLVLGSTRPTKFTQVPAKQTRCYHFINLVKSKLKHNMYLKESLYSITAVLLDLVVHIRKCMVSWVVNFIYVRPMFC